MNIDENHQVNNDIQSEAETSVTAHLKIIDVETGDKLVDQRG